MRKSLPSSLPKIGVVIDLVEKISPLAAAQATPHWKPMRTQGSSSSSSSNASAPSRRQPATALFFRKWKKGERSFFVAPLFCLPPSPYSHLPRPDERTNLALRGVHCTFLAAAPSSSSCRSHPAAMQPASNPPRSPAIIARFPTHFCFPRYIPQSLLDDS